MTRDEIGAALEAARERLADVEETFEFTCANTNAHLSGGLIEDFAQELDECRAEVKRFEGMLGG